MAEKKNHSDSKARFVVGTVVHAIAWIAFAIALCFGILAIITYVQRPTDEGMDGFGAALGAVILFVVFLIAGGVHQVLGHVGIPILFPCRRAADSGRRRAARILLIIQAVTLVMDFILFAVILCVFHFA